MSEVHARDHLWTHVPQEVPGALAGLRQRGYRLAVVSNADGRVEGLLERGGIRDFFEFVLDSHVVRIEKPDPGIFLMACERLGVEPGRCLHVGDIYEVDVRGARAAGLGAVLLDPLERCPPGVARIGSISELPEFLDGL